jgi:hypothetical protein
LVTAEILEVTLIEMPISSGPSVMIAQYTSTRWIQGRWVLTRQIRLNTWSTVDIVKTEVTISAMPPTADSLADLLAN